MKILKSCHPRDIFLERVYELANEEKLDIAIDLICSHMNELLVRKNFAEADLILQMFDPKRVPPVLMVAFLLISRHNKDRLLNRCDFFEQPRNSILVSRGDIHDLDGL